VRDNFAGRLDDVLVDYDATFGPHQRTDADVVLVTAVAIN
jgi:hypothetical protein